MLPAWEVAALIARPGQGSMIDRFSPLAGPIRGLLVSAALWAAAPALAETLPDARVTSAAQILGGVKSDYPPHAHVAALAAWQTHRKTLAPRWDRLQRTRLSVIESWRNEVLQAEVDRCRTLLYPFSGPDFLNAYLMFPRCDTYVLFGLEPPGEVPALEGMDAKETAALLEEVRTALGDILARNYFVTRKMSEQLRTPRLTGTVPIMLTAMGLLDLRVAAIEPFDLAQVSGPHPSGRVDPARRAKGVKLTFFRPPAGKPQTLYYFALNVTDGALRANPEFLPFLEQFAPSMTFIKSASYLLHAKEFTRIRQTLLDASELVVQDDTGIPYAILVDRKFDIQLFGVYAPPIKDFPNALQEDLFAAYQQEGNVAALPFSFGYHWQKGRSGLIVARSAAKKRS